MRKRAFYSIPSKNRLNNRENLATFKFNNAIINGF